MPYTSLAKQLMIENYFNMGPLTDYYYWIGARRSSAGSAFELANGGALPQGASNSPSYAHWSWFHSIANGTTNYDCVIAQQAFKYERFLGNSSDARQLADSRYYNTDPRNQELAYGWNAYPCGAKLHFVCEVPASVFPCFPPPKPPLAPGAPPPPPSPPQPAAGMGTGGGSGSGDCKLAGFPEACSCWFTCGARCC